MNSLCWLTVIFFLFIGLVRFSLTVADSPFDEDDANDDAEQPYAIRLRCKGTEEHIQYLKMCVKEVRPDLYVYVENPDMLPEQKTELNITQQDIDDFRMCCAKKLGLIDSEGVYHPEVARANIHLANETDEKIRQEALESIDFCIKDRDLKEDSDAILRCNQQKLFEVCVKRY